MKKSSVQIICLLLASVLIILVSPYAAYLIHGLLAINNLFLKLLINIFSGGKIATLVSQVLALLLTPLIIAAIPSLLVWLVRRRSISYFMSIFTAVWLMLAVALLVK